MSDPLTNNSPDTPDDALDDLLQSLRSMVTEAAVSHTRPVVVEPAQQLEPSIINIEAQCNSYLDDQLCYNCIRIDSEEYKDVLEIETSSNSHSIQQIIDDHNRYLQIIHLLPPAPRLLPIRILDIYQNDNPYIIPSDLINIEGFLSTAPQYRLEAVVCLTNCRRVVYLRHWPTRQWYYYQNNQSCIRLDDQKNRILNSTIESRSIETTSINYHKQNIENAGPILTVIFRNAIKYFYKPMI